MRIDSWLFENGLAKSRTHAANLIKLHRVFLGGILIEKPSYDLKKDETPVLSAEEDFYSLGGYKLQKVVNDFKIDLKDKVSLDAGCANGGFTGVLLNGGASHVFAVDVGENALPNELNTDKRVSFLRKNVRELFRTDFDKQIDFICADLSFISLKLVLPTFHQLLQVGGTAVLLIKPQFEAGKKFLSKSGIVKDEKVHRKIITELSDFAKQVGFSVCGITPAPHPFQDKNQEYLIYLSR